MKQYPCKKCKIKKAYAKYDYHWLNNEDCPFLHECPYKKEVEKDETKID